MKKALFILFFFSLVSLEAQIDVGPKLKKSLPKKLARLKATKTVFVCKDSDDTTAFETELKKKFGQ